MLGLVGRDAELVADTMGNKVAIKLTKDSSISYGDFGSIDTKIWLLVPAKFNRLIRS